jgi:hypothetical protein
MAPAVNIVVEPQRRRPRRPSGRYRRWQSEMRQDPLDDTWRVNQRQQSQTAAAAAAQERIEATRLRAMRSGEVSPKLGMEHMPSEGGKLRRISSAQSMFRCRGAGCSAFTPASTRHAAVDPSACAAVPGQTRWRQPACAPSTP